MLSAALFELEGVLADTAAMRRDALRRSLADERVALSDAEYGEVCAGLPIQAAARAALARRGAAPDDTALELVALRAERYFAESAGKGLSLAEGARELVVSLFGRVRLAVVTRATRREAGFVLSLSGLEFAFECVVTADDVGDPKPSPAQYERALGRLARRRPVAPAAALALEDGPAGIRAARRAGVRCAAVGPLPAHEALDADAYLPTLRGQSYRTLAELLDRIAERVP